MITWTEDRVAELKRHWANGLSASESADRLGATRNAIAGKRCRLGMRDQMRSVHPAKSREWMKARSIHKAIARQAPRPQVRVVPVTYRKRLPEMSKAALREMLRCAVVNTI